MKAPDYYFQLREGCRDVVEHYRADLLIHDRRIIRNHCGRKFLHMAHNTGTHIMVFPRWDDLPGPGEKVRIFFHDGGADECVDWVRELVKWCVKNCPPETASNVWHWFDGEKLHRVYTSKQIEKAAKQLNRVMVE